MKHLYKIFILLFIVSSQANGQVVINEIVAANYSAFTDEDGDYSDWIELYNAGNSTVNLAGYRIGKKSSFKDAWALPGYFLRPGERIVVFASGKNRGLPQPDHWETPVWAHDLWKYTVNTNPGANWTLANFNDILWSNGKAGVGYGDGDDSVVTANNIISVFLRKKFNIIDTAEVVNMLLTMDYDDGFVAYLNGTEIARSNMSGTPPAWNDAATTDHEALMYQGSNPETFNISSNVFRGLLKKTSNILAIEVHNTSTASSDLSCIPFLSIAISDTVQWYTSHNLSWLSGISKSFWHTNFDLNRNDGVYLYNEKGNLVDSKLSGYLEPGMSVARMPDGQSWCISMVSTPDDSNGQNCIPGYADQPLFSLKAGIYKSNKTLTLSTAQANCIIRYTTNGDVPSSNSKLYTSAISLTKEVVIRARCFDTTNIYLPSKPATNTYIVSTKAADNTFKIPIISVTTDSLNLWDWDTGIYVLGPNATAGTPNWGANFWMDWERSCHIEYFKPQGTQEFELDAALSIHGGWSRSFAKKGFRLEMKDQYDSSHLDYKLFPFRKYTHIKGFNLRMGGNDWQNANLRDELANRVVLPTNIDGMENQAAAVFLNGAYWGLYFIREKEDEDFLAAFKGANGDSVDLLRVNGTVLHGDNAVWGQLYSDISSYDLTVDSNYNNISTRLDIENFTDYISAETYYCNGDWIGSWINNLKVWRDQRSGGKFRYLMYDTDFGQGLADPYNEDRLAIFRNPSSGWNYHTAIFNYLAVNTNFKNYFVNRYADLMNTIWVPANYGKHLTWFIDTLKFDMLREFKRWTGQTDLSAWTSNVNNVKAFIDNRRPYARNFLQNSFGLSGQVTLTLNVSPAGAGVVKISTIIPDKYPWSGVYFNGVPVMVTAIANPGYTFDHFNIGASKVFSQSYTQNYTAATNITATFSGSGQALKLSVSEINYNSPKDKDGGNWIELKNNGNYILDISNWKFHTQTDYHYYTFPTGTTIAANGYLVICEDTIRFKTQHNNIPNKIGNFGFSLGNSSDSIVIIDNLGKTRINFAYADTAPWPQLADGTGRTLERLYDSLSPNNPLNWFNGCPGGSPGKAFTPCTAPVVVSEINYKSAGFADAGDWVELYNTTNTSVSISNWHFKDGDDSDDYIIPTGTILPANGRIVLASNLQKFQKIYTNVSNVVGPFVFGLKSEGEILRLFDSTGDLEFQMLYDHKQPWWPQLADGKGYTLELKDSVKDYSSPIFWTTGCLLGSPGTARQNCNYPLNISEINYHMEATHDKGDYIEIHNDGKYTLDVSGWTLYTKNGTYTFPGGSQFPNKSYTVIAGDSNYSQFSTIVVAGFMLNDTSDSIFLKDLNSQVIFSSKYDQSVSYPLYTNGYGLTMEITTGKADPMLSSSWFGGCIGGSPGTDYLPCQTSIMIHELNIQPHPQLDAGNWIELYNYNPQAIDLYGWSLKTQAGTMKILTHDTIFGKQFKVVVANVAKFNSLHNAIGMISIPGMQLNTASDHINIYNEVGILQNFVGYQNTISDSFAFGKGYTLEAWNITPNLSNYLANTNWKHSCTGGTPGLMPGNCKEFIGISEVNYRSDTLYNTGDWMELVNTGNTLTNLYGNTIYKNGVPLYTFQKVQLLQPGKRLILSENQSKFNQLTGLSSTETGIILSKTDTILLTMTSGFYQMLALGSVAGKMDDGYGTTLERIADTGAWTNGCPGGSPMQVFTACQANPVVTEINGMPGPWVNEQAYLEIYNHSDTVVSLNQYKIGTTVNNAYTIINTNLLPHQRMIFAPDSTVIFAKFHPFVSLYKSQPTLYFDPAGIIRIWNANNKPISLTSYNHNVGGSYNGHSLELTDTNNYNAVHDATAFAESCWSGSPGLPPADSCIYNITVTEINFNPAAKLHSGTWLELHNLSRNSINIDNWTLYSSDGTRQTLKGLLGVGSFSIYASDTNAFRSVYSNIPSQLLEVSLSRNGDVALYDERHQLRFFITLDGTLQSMSQADGTGYTLELADSSNGNFANPARFASYCFGGSPGSWATSPCVDMGIGNTVENQNSVYIYPNPSDQVVYISTEQFQSRQIYIYDAAGKKVLEQFQNGKTLTTINTAHLPSGIYMIKVEQDGNVYTRKLRVVH